MKMKKFLIGLLVLTLFNTLAVSSTTVKAEETADIAITVEDQAWDEPELRDTEIKEVGWYYELTHTSFLSTSTLSGTGESELDLLQEYSGKIKEALLNGETQVSLSGLSITSDNEQFNHLGYYCPYTDGTNISIILWTTTSGKFAYIEIKNSLTTEETQAWVAKIDEKLAELSELISDSSLSTADKALVLHDYMAAHYHYDTTYTDYYPSIMLTEKEGVCQAYAYLFQYIMNEKGVECYTACSSGEGSMKHAWNIIKIGSHYYHIDVTWDDPTNDQFGEAQHDYFLLSDSTIESGTNPHYGWDLTSYACNDSSYEDDYFSSATSPVVFNGNDRFYIDANGLEDYNLDTLTTTKVEDLGYWLVWENSYSYYTGAYSGLFEYDGKLYYNTKNAVRTYDLTTKESSDYAKPSTTDGYIYGIVNENQQISFELAQKPGITYSSKNIQTLDLPEKTAVVELSTAVTLTIAQGQAFSAGKIKVTGAIANYADMADDLDNIKEHGIIYIAATRMLDSNLTVETSGRTKVSFTEYSPEGTFSYTFRQASSASQYVVVSYIKDDQGVYYYSDPITVE